MAEIELTTSDSVATIRLNRPERRNALSSAMMVELERLLAEIERDEAIRVLILTGAGGVFCSGLDLGAMGATPRQDRLEQQLVDGVLRPLEGLRCPTIAAMNGDALAGGLELALHCDLRIAVPHARLGMPLARIGIVVPYPLVLKLIDTVGSAVTSEMLFTAEPLAAERALELAMVNRLVAAQDLAAEAVRTARTIAGNAPLSIAAMKRAIAAGGAHRTLEASDVVRTAAERARSSEDAQEGIRAILEKRKPTFHGR